MTQTRKQVIQMMSRLAVRLGKRTLVATSLALSIAGTALAAGWDSPATVSGWNILTDDQGKGSVELYTSVNQYAFPLDTAGQGMLDEIRDAKNNGRAIYVRNMQRNYCYSTRGDQTLDACRLRVWGVSQVR